MCFNQFNNVIFMIIGLKKIVDHMIILPALACNSRSPPKICVEIYSNAIVNRYVNKTKW